MLAWSDGDADDENQTDRQAGAFRVAEWMLKIETALTGLKGSKKR